MHPLIEMALAEDIGTGDITTNSCVPADRQAKGVFIAREHMTIAGTAMLQQLYDNIELHHHDGDTVEPGAQTSHTRTNSPELPPASVRHSHTGARIRRTGSPHQLQSSGHQKNHARLARSRESGGFGGRNNEPSQRPLRCNSDQEQPHRSSRQRHKRNRKRKSSRPANRNRSPNRSPAGGSTGGESQSPAAG